MTRYEAFINQGWEEAGLAQVFLVRIREDGSADLAGLLVDTFCLGVKDAYGDEGVVEAAVREFIDERLPDDFRERIHPACAKKLIEGAVAYAESLGFAPHRDYRKARRIFSGVDVAVCPRDFDYGCEGRPRYVRGPDDEESRVERVCGILEARFGPDGFDYADPAAEEEDDLAVREDLMAFLDAEAREVPRFYELSGLITAMLVAPGDISMNGIFQVLWPEGTQAAHGRDAVQGFLDLLKAYWNQVNDRVLVAVDPHAPLGVQILDLWEEDFPEGETGGLAMAAATCDWAKGFRRAIELWPEAWGDAPTRPELAPHWEVVGWWAEFNRAENRDRIVAHAEAEPKRTLNLSVIALARALREPLPPA